MPEPAGHGEGSAAKPRNLAVVSAGTSDPSTTTMLARLIAERVAARKPGSLQLHSSLIELRPLATDVTNALVSGFASPALEAATSTLREADAVIVATPVYKAGPSGLLLSFFQVLDNDLLIGTPVVLAATGGSARHALVVDEQLRGLFAYLRTIVTPTSIFATAEDWGGSGASENVQSRADRAATELLALVSGGFRDTVRAGAWTGYQHSFGSAGGTETGIDLDTDLMRLATGGSSPS